MIIIWNAESSRRAKQHAQISTHSFLASVLTQTSNATIPLRLFTEINGHRYLKQLQKYQEVSDKQVLGAALTLGMLSPV